MYDIALTVRACLEAGTSVEVAWAVELSGFEAVTANEALAITPGGGRVGGVLWGALDNQLVDQAAMGRPARLVALEVGELDTLLVGRSGAGSARCLVAPAADLPEALWDRLVDRQPVCLVASLDEGGSVTQFDLYDADTVDAAGEEPARLFRRGSSGSGVVDGKAVTVLWPVPKLFLLGSGPIAGALSRALTDAAELLGWQVHEFTDSGEAAAHVTGLSALDCLVVYGHDDGLVGPALRAALGGPVGYIGSIGPAAVQESRRDWLVRRGVNDLSRIHGPAGLDIGASGPPEIALAVLAQAVSVRSSVRRAQQNA